MEFPKRRTVGSPLWWNSLLHFLFPWTESGIKTLNGYYVTSARGGRSNQERHQRGASAVLLILCTSQMQASCDAQKSQSEYRSPLETPASTGRFILIKALPVEAFREEIKKLSVVCKKIFFFKFSDTLTPKRKNKLFGRKDNLPIFVYPSPMRVARRSAENSGRMKGRRSISRNQAR